MEKNMKKRLTREEFLKKYPNPFKLVSHAIALARDLVITQRRPRVEESIKNPSYIALQEIAKGKDILEDVPKEEIEDEVEE